MRKKPGNDNHRRQVQILSDGQTVWVNADNGSCIGRFGRMGIDIHKRIEEQDEGGECLFCTHGPTGPDEWEKFVEKMKDLYQVDIADRHMPTRIRQSTRE